MTATINASTSSGLIQTADTSGTLALQSNGTTQLTVSSTGVAAANTFQMNSGYGSVATAYGCRAWVNFDGTGAISIRASGNVSSITDNGTGDYTVNFTTAMPDLNYAPNVTCMRDSAAGASDPAIGVVYNSSTYSDSYKTTSIRIKSIFYTGSGVDARAVNVSIFR